MFQPVFGMLQPTQASASPSPLRPHPAHPLAASAANCCSPGVALVAALGTLPGLPSDPGVKSLESARRKLKDKYKGDAACFRDQDLVRLIGSSKVAERIGATPLHLRVLWVRVQSRDHSFGGGSPAN